MKKVLVIDESPLMRDFLCQKLEEHGFELVVGVNGLDGSVKARQQTPDLIIMEYYLSRLSSVELLEKLRSDPNTANIPVIMASSKVDREKVLQVAKFNIRKFFFKPIKVDAVLKSVAEILNITLDIDATPCIIEAHVNEDVIFVEIAQGLNKEKIQLLKYKIKELVDLYELQNPKVLMMFSNLEIDSADSFKLSALLQVVTEHSGAKNRAIKILTNSDFIGKYVRSRNEFSDIEVVDSLQRAMDGLMGRKSGSFVDSQNKTVQHDFLQTRAPKKEKEESIHLRFEGEREDMFSLSDLGDDIEIAIVDDDIVMQELVRTTFSDTNFGVTAYENGREFVEDAREREYDLVFLDLMMPEMDGFAVLAALKEQKRDVPIIVLSALSKRDTVVKAMAFGVKSYMIKPLKPEGILKKSIEILKLKF